MTERGLTANEAAFVLEITPEQIKKAFDRNVVPIRGAQKGNRTLDMADLVLLRFHFTHPELSAEQRRIIADELGKRRSSVSGKGKGHAKSRIAGRLLSLASSGRGYTFSASSDGKVTADLSLAVEEVARRSEELEKLSALVELQDDGEPQISGTGIPVYRVAALVCDNGGSLDLTEARRGFPSLSDEIIEASYRYGCAYPKKGRPYDKRSLKSIMDEIEFPLLDDEE